MTQRDKASAVFLILFAAASMSYFLYAIGHNIKIEKENNKAVKLYKEQLIKKYSTNLVIDPIATSRIIDMKLKQYQDSLDCKLIMFPEGEINR